MPLDKLTAHKEPEKVRKKPKLKRLALPHTTNSVVIPPMPNLDCPTYLGVFQTGSSMYCISCLILS
ncbi:hypothetical protein BCR42DRAFT_418783 [Absidia repens]|uniref:Uncharacterized protein n=1 Tax=Absidia repens TaxID=90262 RepID=A0A1X2IC18_9FUNG|nr:hypothetical protein BCR42DRAFT_418783 [Absidia repens]